MKTFSNIFRHEKNVQTNNIANTTDMRRQILNLERDVTREKAKSRALEEQLETQTNVHRWRILEGTDPPAFDLIQKNQVLQKRLLAISETITERDAQLQDSQNLCKSLKDRLSRQPGPDLVLRLQEAQHAVREKGKKIKCLTAQLSMNEAMAKEYKSDLEKVNEELKLEKYQYFAQKRREQKMKERETSGVTLPPINPRGCKNLTIKRL
ncbi:cilia- and flagella-associated protein 58-like [Periplaneta americana]|uniref:cilia- and flagella-associated protein 58-like n=1 Tax=Periplaneta americana TaxID=6978 RepID=UPI0037E98EF9